MSMLLCFDTYFQESDTNSLIELSSENNLTADSLDADLDVNEEYQAISATSFLAVVKGITVHNHLHFINRPSSPFFSIWQPPKLS